MPLDPRLWQSLEDHGVTQEHLEVLLTVLELQRNGALTWQVVQGHVAMTEVKLHIPSRRREMGRVRAELFAGLTQHPRRA